MEAVMLREPSPYFACVNISDGFADYSETRRDFALGQGAAKRSDFLYIRNRELGVAALLPSVMGAVLQSIRLVADARFPRKMTLGHATIAALSAGVRGFMLRSRRRAVCGLAHHVGDVNVSPVQPQVSIATSARERPNQAFVAFVGQHHIMVKAERLPCSRAPTKGVIVNTPSLPMACAPSARAMRLAAARNRAYPLGSHVEPPMLPWSEPARGAATPGGFAICSAEPPENKGTKP